MLGSTQAPGGCPGGNWKPLRALGCRAEAGPKAGGKAPTVGSGRAPRADRGPGAGSHPVQPEGALAGISLQGRRPPGQRWCTGLFRAPRPGLAMALPVGTHTCQPLPWASCSLPESRGQSPGEGTPRGPRL